MSKEYEELIKHLASYLEFSKVLSKVSISITSKQLRMIIKELVKAEKKHTEMHSN